MTSSDAFFNAKIANLSLFQDLGDLSMAPYRHLSGEWLGRKIIEVKREGEEIFVQAHDVVPETASRVHQLGLDILMVILLIPGTVTGTVLKGLSLLSSETREVYSVVNAFFLDQAEPALAAEVNLMAFLPGEDLSQDEIEEVYQQMKEVLEDDITGEELQKLAEEMIVICERFRESYSQVDVQVRSEAEDKKVDALARKKNELEESYNTRVENLLPHESGVHLRFRGMARQQAAFDRNMAGLNLENLQNERRVAYEAFQAQTEREVELQWIPQRRVEIVDELLANARESFQTLRTGLLNNPTSVLE